MFLKGWCLDQQQQPCLGTCYKSNLWASLQNPWVRTQELALAHGFTKALQMILVHAQVKNDLLKGKVQQRMRNTDVSILRKSNVYQNPKLEKVNWDTLMIL